MAKVSLGVVGIVNKGDYSSTATYYKGNFVYYDGSSYVCLKDSLNGVTPINDSVNWRYLARGFDDPDTVRLKDDSTGIVYSLGIYNGVLYIETTNYAATGQVTLKDTATNTNYKLGVDNGMLYTVEA